MECEHRFPTNGMLLVQWGLPSLDPAFEEEQTSHMERELSAQQPWSHLSDMEVRPSDVNQPPADLP